MYDVDRTVATLVLLVSQKYCIGSNDPQIIYQYMYITLPMYIHDELWMGIKLIFTIF